MSPLLGPLYLERTCLGSRVGGVAVAGLLLAAAAAADPGLQADYYNSLTPPVLGLPGDFVRTDAVVDFVWPGDAPTGTSIVPDDQYSTRWSGFVRIDAPGTWTFKTVSNDGVRLWVNGLALIDAWTQHAAQEDEGALVLPGAGWYPILLEHFNDGGTAEIELRFEGPGQADVVIPATHLATDFPGGTSIEADAGPTQIVKLDGNPFVLDGTISGGFGGINALWLQIAGPPAVIATPGATQTSVFPSATGLHTFQLLAYDQAGGYIGDLVDVYVTSATQTGSVSGTLRKWYPLTLDFQHDRALDESLGTNPFLDLRLQVHFVHLATETVHDVPGYFAADGNAADSSAKSGSTWRVRFTPDKVGTWHYVAFFRSGTDVALSEDPTAGAPTSFDGASGSFDVESVDPTAPGFHREGRLEHVGLHYLRFHESNRLFLKTGSNSPENLLGYYEFDDAMDLGGAPNDLESGGAFDGLHHFESHEADYAALGGGPTWKLGKGQALIGALNYLASQGVNSLYFLTYNIDGGDGGEVYPWAVPTDKLHYDVSKLEQWSRVLDHMQDVGIHAHVVLQEVENQNGLDGGALGRERRLYYRELVARFGHALALTWNLGEEYGGSEANLEAYADALRDLDPWSHPLQVHTLPDQIDTVYGWVYGNDAFTGASLQMDPEDTIATVQRIRDASEDAGQPWAVCFDEQNPANDGVQPDANDPDHDAIRQEALWATFLAGGAGVEWYFGYDHEHNDLDCEDFRSRAEMWRQSRDARSLLEAWFPLERMAPEDRLATASDAQVLAESGERYLVYRPFGGVTSLDLEGYPHTFRVEWFDAKNGGALQTGSVTSITGPGVKSLGAPPAGGLDWVALVRRADNRPPVLAPVQCEPTPFRGDADLTIGVRVDDPDGYGDVVSVSCFVFAPDFTYGGVRALSSPGAGTWALRFPDLPALTPGTWWLVAVARDSAGQYGWSIGSFLAE